MNDNKENILLVENIFNSLSSKDLESNIENSNSKINSSIEKLANLFNKPRNFLKSDYAEYNRFVNSIVELKQNEPIKSWIKELSDFNSKYIKKEHVATIEPGNKEKCDEIIDQASEIKATFENDYSNIIKDIQYHDIIRQKLEHIIEINNDTLKEIYEFKLNKAKRENGEFRYLVALKEIMSIEIAQLTYCHELCKSAIERITFVLNEQKNLLEKTEELILNIKKRVSSVLQIIQQNKELNDILEANKDTYNATYQLSTKEVELEFSRLMPDKNQFTDHQKVYDSYISIINETVTKESNYYQTVQGLIDSLLELQKKLFKDEGIKNLNKETNLDFLKKKYTMNSEYKIHELAMENEFLKDFFSEITETEENNDVEFF